MRVPVILILLAFVGLWLSLMAFLTGSMPITWLPDALSKLKLPHSAQALGDSLAILDGLFTSIAIVLGLVAILFQGKELKASTEAQTLQAEALSKQIIQQEASNKLGAYSARLQFLSAEIEHMENKIPDMVEQANNLRAKGEAQKSSELWEIIKSTRNKQQRFRDQASIIDEQIQRLLT